MSIPQNQALFSIIGTSYGGNGVQTFALPNLQGRTPVHVGGSMGNVIGLIGGEETHTLLTGEMPAHVHILQGVTQAGTVEVPAGNFLAQTGSALAYQPVPPGNLQPMSGASIGSTGNNQAHENRAPFLVLNFIISLSGIFPTRN